MAVDVIDADITRNTPYNELPAYLTAKQAATYVGCNTWTIYQGMREGNIPHRTIGNKLKLIPKEYFHVSNARTETV